MNSGSGFEYELYHTVIIVISSVIAYIFYSLMASRIFAKAGVKPWQAWVPFLVTWRLLQLGGKPGWFLLIGLIPIVGQIIYLIQRWIAQYRIGLGLEKSGVFVILAILLEPVWFLVLAIDGSTWSPKHTSLVPESARS
ncbi:hypothetical protein M2152_000315 [Microbacteriaceae bacterium SG_E_30_P1]|uniref:Uncharacterized protein n=1 Tax=Antiquaquibacter oligotrophicus TaxID=2880260 RepID=A0ABT6KJK3_9MICO|nr:DUF5684 domain-containing protein [Antiquaquibacter oligotrophicus]MDH6180133.1 hypothetical protein [Antiquaquibacter oligotrophicus]UDF14116.1 DUF5684 domain-containing protein [Antiquaquibacter oligotrophicus]